MEVRTGITAGQGLGDTIADFTHLTGIDKLASKYEGITGVPCGCKERQEKLNELFPQPVGLII
jgi:hypothetical protein